MDLYARSISLLDTENAFKIGQQIIQAESSGEKVLKLNLGQPDFPIPAWVKEEVKAQIDLNNTQYCDPQGLLSLRVAIVNHLQRTREVTYSPEQVVIFPGAKPAIGFCQQVYCNPGDDILYPSPGYPIFESFVRYVGANPVPILLKEEAQFSFSPEQLSELITKKTKLIFLNFPSNPTGGTTTRAALEKLSEVILKKCDKNVRVYSDEIYEDILFDGHHHHSIASVPGMEKITIVSSGFSKSFSWTGGRVGYAVFPSIDEALVFKNMNINYFSCVSPYNQEGARVALENPQSATYIQHMIHSFQSRRNLVLKALEGVRGVTCHVPKATFYIFPNIQAALESLGVMEAYNKLAKAFQDTHPPTKIFQMFALHRHRVAIMDRESFGKISARNQHYIRISSATDESSLLKGLDNLQTALADRSGFQSFFKQYAHSHLS